VNLYFVVGASYENLTWCTVLYFVSIHYKQHCVIETDYRFVVVCHVYTNLCCKKTECLAEVTSPVGKNVNGNAVGLTESTGFAELRKELRYI
jgi:hypothetical protein